MLRKSTFTLKRAFVVEARVEKTGSSQGEIGYGKRKGTFAATHSTWIVVEVYHTG